jgi:hypothetical protein
VVSERSGWGRTPGPRGPHQIFTSSPTFSFHHFPFSFPIPISISFCILYSIILFAIFILLAEGARGQGAAGVGPGGRLRQPDTHPRTPAVEFVVSWPVSSLDWHCTIQQLNTITSDVIATQSHLRAAISLLLSSHCAPSHLSAEGVPQRRVRAGVRAGLRGEAPVRPPMPPAVPRGEAWGSVQNERRTVCHWESQQVSL